MSSIPSQSGRGSSSSSRAPKGRACLSCRRRKMKCDCVQPVCGQCVHFNRQSECEYTYGEQRTRTELLEEQVMQLHTRLRALENPLDRPVVEESNLVVDAPALEEPNDVPMTYVPSNSEALRMSNSDDLIEAFLTYSEDLGFFLNAGRFTNHVSRTTEVFPGDPEDPLLNAVYLWGSILRDEDHGVEYFLPRVLRYLPPAYAARPSNVLHLLQTELLLSNYYFYAGKFVEARKSLASAVSIVLTYKLHKTRTAHQTNCHGLGLTDWRNPLHPAIDSVEEGERIRGFWYVYILDKSWASALDVESLLVEDGSPATRIDVPWPRAPEMYQSDELCDEYKGSRTVQRFLNETICYKMPTTMCPHALRAQATVLLDRAKWLSSTCSSDPALMEIHKNTFNKVDAQIEDFILSLPTLDVLHTYHPAHTRSLVTTHMVARMAIMQLYIAFADTDIVASMKCLSASKAILAAFKVLYNEPQALSPDFHLNAEPFLLILLTSSARIMLIEENKFNANTALWRNMASCTRTGYMQVVLEDLIGQMARVNAKSGLTVAQVRKAKDASIQTYHFRPAILSMAV